MNAGMIGLRAHLENAQDAAGKLVRAPGAERPQDNRGVAAKSETTQTAGLRKAGDAARRAGDDPGKLAQAAQEFESLLLAQILRMVREAGSGGWLGSGESQEMSSTMELAETQLARAMAQSGALGISKMFARDNPAEARLAASPAAAENSTGPAVENGAVSPAESAARTERGQR